MQTRARLANTPCEFALDGHVDVFVVDVEDKAARIDIGLDLLKTGANRLLILARDDALRGEHGGMRLGTGNILLVELPINRQRRAKLLRRLGDVLLEPAAPKRHGKPPR